MVRYKKQKLCFRTKIKRSVCAYSRNVHDLTYAKKQSSTEQTVKMKLEGAR